MATMQAVQEYLASLESSSLDERAQRVTGLCYDLMLGTAKFFEEVVAHRDFETFGRYFLPLSEALSKLHHFNREVIGPFLPHDNSGARWALREFGCSVATLGLEMKYHDTTGRGVRFSQGTIQEDGAALQLLGTGIVNVANSSYSPSTMVVGIAEAKKSSLLFLDGVVNKLTAEAFLMRG